jgi:hypothetical protein
MFRCRSCAAATKTPEELSRHIREQHMDNIAPVLLDTANQVHPFVKDRAGVDARLAKALLDEVPFPDGTVVLTASVQDILLRPENLDMQFLPSDFEHVAELHRDVAGMCERCLWEPSTAERDDEDVRFRGTPRRMCRSAPVMVRQGRRKEPRQRQTKLPTAYDVLAHSRLLAMGKTAREARRLRRVAGVMVLHDLTPDTLLGSDAAEQLAVAELFTQKVEE